MFGLIRAAVSTAYNVVRNAMAPKPAPKAAPKPVYTPPRMAAPPAPSFRPIANYGESAASIAQRTAVWRASPAARAQSSWITQSDSQARARAAAAAAEAARRAEEERKAAARRKAQGDLDNKLGSFRNIVGGAAKKALATVGNWFGKKGNEATTKNSHEGFSSQAEADSFNKWYKQQAPEKRAEVDAFNRTKNEYENNAKKLVDGHKKATTGWFGLLPNNKGREFAQQQVDKLSTQQVKKYKTTLNSFLKQQTGKKEHFESTKFKSQAEFDKALKEYTDWESKNIKSLEYTRAATTGLMAGYGTKASEKLTDPVSKAGSWFNKNVVQGVPGKALGGIWKYTLGQGSENVPSAIRAPGRVVNTWLNRTGATQQRNYHGGKTENAPVGTFIDAWKKSYNQRNFNWSQPKKGTEQDFESWYKTKDKSQWRGQPEKKVRAIYKNVYYMEKNNETAGNYTAEAIADPAGTLGKVGKVAGKAAGWLKTAVGATKVGSALSTVNNSGAIKWLKAEHKTPDQKFIEIRDAAKITQEQAQKTFLPRLNALNKKLTGDQKLDVSVFDDLGKLSDSEAAMLQRMVDGKMSARDRIILYSPRGKNPMQTRLEDLAKRWTDFTEKMKLADNVEGTRFGRGQKLYAPDTSWIDRTGSSFLDRYNFRKKRGSQTLKSKDLKQGAVDRYFKSDLDQLHAGQATSKRGRVKSERDELLRRYDEMIQPARENVERAHRKTKTPWARAQKVAGAPTRLWKKSVLKYRPAWTVNNVLYNTQAGVLASGAGSLAEQAKMINPRYWRKAMDEVPDSVKTDLAKEVGGKGKLNKFYNGVENWSRVAAFRASKNKGLTDDAALGRVNKYMYDYKTKNWERPLKTVMPFWAWNKNLTKAAAGMPFDRPAGALAYNKLDRYQQQQFDKEFESVVPELLEYGYTEDEIEKIKADQAKYYKGRLKVGDKWITTPFNAFSEKGLTGLGFNPYATAVGESADAEDNFKRKTSGKAAGLGSRLISKFPQAELGRKSVAAWRVASGADKPRAGWIGKKGSEGYGLTKEKQGFDPSKKNYVASMDPRKNLSQDFAAFGGVPRGLTFDKSKFLEGKKLQKMTAEYFAIDAKNMEFSEADAAREAVFKKYGMKADDFYGGVLSKYDTDATSAIKQKKAQAAGKNKALFEEYSRQPSGSRNLWATQKLKSLVDEGYFNDNPFLKSFKWTNPTTIAKANRQGAYLEAKRTGDWTKWRKTYGTTQSQKSKDREKAVASGDWTEYRKKYGTKGSSAKAQFWGAYQAEGDAAKRRQMLRENPQYAKRPPKSEAEIAEAQFWGKYMAASPADRKTLIAANPQYNKRANWTDEQWDASKAETRSKTRTKARGWGNFAALENEAITAGQKKASTFLRKKSGGHTKKVVWR